MDEVLQEIADWYEDHAERTGERHPGGGDLVVCRCKIAGNAIKHRHVTYVIHEPEKQCDFQIAGLPVPFCPSCEGDMTEDDEGEVACAH
jgi:hypothetical protein